MMFPVYILFFSSIGWGLTWLPVKYLNQSGIDGVELIFIAFSAASIVMLPQLLRQRSRWLQHTNFLLSIALVGGIANIAFQASLIYGEVVRVMILFYLLPIWSVIGGRLFLKEEIDGKRIFTVVSCITGAFLILGGMAIFEQTPSWIDVMSVISGFAYAMNNLLFRATQQIPVASKVAAMFIGCAVLLGGYLFLIPAEQFANQTVNNISLTILYGITWLSLVSFGSQWGVTQIEAGRASIIIVMELVAAVVSAALILGQVLSVVELLGIVLVISSVMIEGTRKPESA
jgi:drug/metabolite transporter (DMT)-like permease